MWCYSCRGLVLHIKGFCHPKKGAKVPSRGGGEGSGPGDSFQGHQPPSSPPPPPGAPLAGRGSAPGGPWYPQTPAVPNPSGKGTARRLLPVLLWQIGLHLEEDVLPLFDEALGLLDGLLLLGTRVGLASGEERQALAAGKPRSQPSTGWCDAGPCLRQGHPKDGKDTWEGRRHLQLHGELLREFFGGCWREGSRGEREGAAALPSSSHRQAGSSSCQLQPGHNWGRES